METVPFLVALAVYSRSLAAFEALKSLNILQLPSRSSVQLLSHQTDPGMKEGSLALQFDLYSQGYKISFAYWRWNPHI